MGKSIWALIVLASIAAIPLTALACILGVNNGVEIFASSIIVCGMIVISDKVYDKVNEDVESKRTELIDRLKEIQEEKQTEH